MHSFGISPVRLILAALLLGLCWFVAKLPVYIANRRGLNWPSWMHVVSFLILLCTTMIGWGILVAVACFQNPPVSEVLRREYPEQGRGQRGSSAGHPGYRAAAETPRIIDRGWRKPPGQNGP